MKFAVCVPPPVCDGYGHLTRYAEKMAEVAAERGMEADALKYEDGDFFARLFTSLMDEECVIHFYCYLYDLQLHARPALKKVKHALDGSRARTVATISDHPFTDFMQGMVRNAHSTTRFIVIDNTFSDEMRFINPDLKETKFSHLPFAPPVSFEDERFVDFDDRESDLVLPLLVVDTSKLTLKKLLGDIGDGWFARVVSATYETVRTDLSQNPFHVFSRCMRAETGAGIEGLRKLQPKAIPGLLRTLSVLDGYVRQERRNRVVSSLLRSVGERKVTVLGKPLASLGIDKKVKFLGAQQAPETAALMANSKAVLNCSPSYPTNIHERVTVGMLYESCVITDTNPCIEETFSSEEYVSYGPGSAMTIDDIFATHDTRAIAKQSARTARENPAFSWHGHFDAVMEIAQA